jgi:catechol 2,3-dioxygenase
MEVLGPVRLVVGDLDTATSFYERAIGLATLERDGDAAVLGPAGGQSLVQLVGRPEAPPRPPRTTGLFHLALLVPSRPALARALRRVVDSGARLTGASDHLVSEALYLHDSEGNGIELYHDRPRDEWHYERGELQMATLPLDLEGLLAELPAGPDAGMEAATRMGHVHLNVADLGAAERFYVDELGFDVTVRSYPGALFVSTGGYHHHIGLNTWAGRGAPAPPPGARGLDAFAVAPPRGERGRRVRDPSGNGVALLDTPRPG